MDKRERELAAYRMKEAEQAFHSGEALLKIEDYRGATNRFYYAAFYATQALLILKGKDARTHSGNLHLFRQEYIKTGDFPEETNQMLSSLFNERLEGDYGFLDEPDKEETEKVLKNCDTFLKNAKTVIKSRIGGGVA